jgi:threonine synthase
MRETVRGPAAAAAAAAAAMRRELRAVVYGPGTKVDCVQQRWQ